MVDHINGDKLDNRRVNLRPANPTEQQANTPKPKNNTSGYKGVTWVAANRKWQAHLRYQRKLRHIGYFATPEEAALAYNEEARRLFGEFCRLNEVPL